jgi:hypothetical protein
MSHNGTNGNGAHKLGLQAEAVERAAAHLAGQRRLAEDAEKQLERASKDRADAESAHARATAARDQAIAKSSANREDSEAADDVVRAEVRLSHCKRDLDVAVAEHTACASTSRTAGAAVGAAEREHERLIVEADLLDPSRRDRMSEHGAAVVHHVAEVHGHLSALLEELEADHVLVRKARTLGSSIAHVDGIGAAVGFAGAMLAKGLDLGGAEAHVLRWIFEAPQDRPMPALGKMLADAVGVLVPALTRKPNPNGAAVLRHAIESWGPHRSWAEARRSALAPPPPPDPAGWLSTKQASKSAQPTRVIGRAVVPQGDQDGEFDTSD